MSRAPESPDGSGCAAAGGGEEDLGRRDEREGFPIGRFGREEVGCRRKKVPPPATPTGRRSEEWTEVERLAVAMTAIEVQISLCVAYLR